MNSAPNTTNFAMVGLGRMGANIVRRLAKHGINSTVFDLSPEAVAALGAEGATTTSSIAITDCP